jgi:ABC-type multidrug transport system fused ATPase/permease subunit
MIEMAEPMFEILLFSAYLSVALISVVIAVFAISVTYFSRESKRSLWSLEKRRKELGLKIKRYKNVDVEQLEKDINLLKKEESSIKDRLFYLSPFGAVVTPCFILIIAIFFSLYGLTLYPYNSEYFIVASLIAIGFGSAFIFQTIRTIGWVSSRVALPKFQIYFGDYQKEAKMKVKEKRKLIFGLENIGDILAEKLRILVFFPPGFKISRGRDRFEILTQSKSDVEFPNHATADMTVDESHIGLCNIFEIVVEAPENPGKYSIPVRIYEKNVPETNLELTINVTE